MSVRMMLDAPTAASVYTMSSGRLGALAGGLLGLAAVVIAGRVLRSAGRIGSGSGRSSAVVALLLALIATALGSLIVATSDGGLGTGNGLGGAFVALLLGLAGAALAGLALTRSRRTG